MIRSGTCISVDCATSKPADGFVEMRIGGRQPPYIPAAQAKVVYALLRDWLPSTTYDELAELFAQDLPTWTVVEVKADGTIVPK